MLGQYLPNERQPQPQKLLFCWKFNHSKYTQLASNTVQGPLILHISMGYKNVATQASSDHTEALETQVTQQRIPLTHPAKSSYRRNETISTPHLLNFACEVFTYLKTHSWASSSLHRHTGGLGLRGRLLNICMCGNIGSETWLHCYGLVAWCL